MGRWSGGSIALPESGRGRGIALAVVFGAIVGLPIALLSLGASAGHPVPPDIRDSIARDDAREAAPVWRAVATRHAGFDVDAPRWRPLGARTTILRRTDGLSRELFQFGEATDGRRHAAIAIDRGEIDEATAGQEIAALTADIGFAARLQASPLALDTKFGPLPAVDMIVDGPAGPKACLAFTLHAGGAGIRMVGWICNAGPEIVSRVEASCFVDRLFAVGLRDPAVASIFARAELRRQPCSNAPASAVTPSGLTDQRGRPAPLRTGRL